MDNRKANHTPTRGRASNSAALFALATAAAALVPFAPQSLAADAAATEAGSDSAANAALQARVDALAAEVAELKAQTSVPKTSAGDAATKPAAANAAPQSSSGGLTFDKNGLVFALPDKSASFKFGLYFQVDQRSWIDGASNDAFLLRRVRLPFSGSIASGAVKFTVIPEFQGADNTAGGTSKLYDAWVEVRHSPALGLRLGKFGSPVSLDSTDPRHFIEATYSSQIVPNRDIGVDATGSLGDGVFSYRLGLYNGAANNDYASTGNLDDHFSVGARLSFAPFKNSGNEALSGLFFGAGAVYGSEKFTAAANAIRSGGQQTVARAFASRGDHLRAAAGLGYFYGPFSLLAEIAADHYKEAGAVGTGFHSVTNHGWYASAGWVLTGEKSTFAGVTPATPFNPAKGHWGAVELTARISGLEVDKDLRGPATVGGAFAYGVGLNWWLTQNILVRIGAERTHFSGLHKTAETPAALRQDELYVFSRFQLVF